MSAILQITNGTITVDLLRHFRLLEWIPHFSQYKQSMQPNALGNYERVINSTQQNVVQTFSLKIRRESADSIFEEMITLIKLLEDATDYWIDEWASSPVYLVNRSPKETNTRYALIHSYRIPGHNNFHMTPFIQELCERLLEFDLVMETGKWLSNIPSETVNPGVSAYRDGSGQTTADMDLQDIFVTNSDRDETISYAKSFIGAVYQDLLSLTAPYVLFSVGATTGDMWYFGDDSPFSNLVINVGFGTSGGLTFAGLAYWDGSAWTTIPTIRDRTVFGGGGRKNIVTWEPPSDWAKTTVDGDNAYWVRYEAIAGTTSGTGVSTTHQVYISTWASALLPSINGTEPALGKINIAIPNSPFAITETPKTYVNRVITGIRGVERGENFSAYINLGNLQNQSGISMSLGADSALDFENQAPCGRRVTYSSVVTDSWQNVLTVAMDPTIVGQYKGEYRVFLRYTQSGGVASTVRLRSLYRAYPTSPSNISDVFLVETTSAFSVADFGKIVIPSVFELDMSYHEILIQIYRTSATPDLYLYDLVLIPTDEWYADCIDQENSASSPLLTDQITVLGVNFRYTNYLSIDSAEQHEELVNVSNRTGLKDYNITDADALDKNDEKGIWSSSTNGPCIFQKDQQQRIWFLAMRTESVNSKLWISRPEVAMNVGIGYTSVYDLGRGSKQ